MIYIRLIEIVIIFIAISWSAYMVYDILFGEPKRRRMLQQNLADIQSLELDLDLMKTIEDAEISAEKKIANLTGEKNKNAE